MKNGGGGGGEGEFTGNVKVMLEPLRALFSDSSFCSCCFNRAFSSAIFFVTSSKEVTFDSNSFTCRSFRSRNAR